MWHMFIMERIDQMENKQKPVERETRQLIQTYNVLLKSQIYAYFAKTQRDHFVGRAFKTLEKEKQIYIHQDLEMAAINEEAFKARKCRNFAGILGSSGYYGSKRGRPALPCIKRGISCSHCVMR